MPLAHLEHLRELEDVGAVVDEELASDEDHERRDGGGCWLRVDGDNAVDDLCEWEVLRVSRVWTAA
jgi:hypothetical protein